MNFMADMSHRLSDPATVSWDSPYARMIPGNPAIPLVAGAPTSRDRKHSEAKSSRAISEGPQLHPPPSRNWMRFLIPKTRTANQWALYQLTSLDLLVLLAACLIPSTLFPAWS